MSTLVATYSQSLALSQLAGRFTDAANGFTLFTGALFGGFFVGFARFHFPENAFTLQLLLQNTEGLIDVVVSNQNLQVISFADSAARQVNDLSSLLG